MNVVKITFWAAKFVFAHFVGMKLQKIVLDVGIAPYLVRGFWRRLGDWDGWGI